MHGENWMKHKDKWQPIVLMILTTLIAMGAFYLIKQFDFVCSVAICQSKNEVVVLLAEKMDGLILWLDNHHSVLNVIET